MAAIKKIFIICYLINTISPSVAISLCQVWQCYKRLWLGIVRLRVRIALETQLGRSEQGPVGCYTVCT